MKASDLILLLQAAIDKHGDYAIGINCEKDELPELCMKYKADVGHTSWYVTLLTVEQL